VIVGAGSMGLLHLLLLLAVNPETTVVLCDPMEERRQLALGLGARAAVPPGSGELTAAVMQVTDGVGADGVFDTVGGGGPLAAGLETLRPGGTVILFAHAREGEPAGFALNPFFKSELRLMGTYSGGLDDQRRVAGLLSSGAFDPSPLVTHRVPLAGLAEAVSLATGRQALKILVGG
jgi:threonine dehydrogenase-like Zn-dependent dehydrogenase